jgi:hypothetical protein
MIEHLGFLVDRQPSKILHVFTVTGEPLLHITMVSGPDPVVSETQPVEPLAMSGFPRNVHTGGATFWRVIISRRWCSALVIPGAARTDNVTTAKKAKKVLNCMVKSKEKAAGLGC